MTRIPSSGNNYFANFISRMTKTDALAPIIALEVTVVSGRTYEAYKRGGKDEARERIIEESMGSIVWIGAVKFFNYLGDKILGKILNQPGVSFDVGTDKILRTPFQNFIKDGCAKNFTAKQVALMKGAKVLTSVLLGNLIIGLIVPKINHALTNKIRHKRLIQEQNIQPQNQNQSQEKDVAQNPSFKGAGLAGLNWFTNAIENTNTGKLLSTDVGCAGGRMLNARKKEERREIAIRDIGSIYFYMWAQGHVRNLLNFVETGKFDRLSPSDAELLQKHLQDFISKQPNKEIGLEEFKKAFIGKPDGEIKLPEGINFETSELSEFSKLLNSLRKNKVEPLQVAKISDLEKLITDEQLMTRLRAMSKLQPERLGEAVITKQQIIDAINISELNDPEFLSKAFNKYTDGASSNKYKYVSNKKLYNYKKQMEEYVELLCKKAKDGKITADLLRSVEKGNYIANGINFVSGFMVAALFLSTLIPKFQYWVTRKTTGVDAFPGVYDYEHHKEVDA